MADALKDLCLYFSSSLKHNHRLGTVWISAPWVSTLVPLLKDVQVGWMEALPFPVGPRGCEMLDVVVSLTALRAWVFQTLDGVEVALPTYIPAFFRSGSGDVPVQWRSRKGLLPGIPSYHLHLIDKNSFNNKDLTTKFHLPLTATWGVLLCRYAEKEGDLVKPHQGGMVLVPKSFQLESPPSCVRKSVTFLEDPELCMGQRGAAIAKSNCPLKPTHLQGQL